MFFIPVPPMKQLIILAGGLGKRLRARLGDLPKPMIPIGGKPLLEHQVELARKHGFLRITIFACYRADLIEQHFGDGSRWGVEMNYVVESEPLGTAGAVLAGLDKLDENFLVLYGDTMVNVDLQRIWEKHCDANAAATLLVHPNDHPMDSDLVETDKHGWITAFRNRPHAGGQWFQNLVNAGLYVLNKSALKSFRRPSPQPSPMPSPGPSPRPSPVGREREKKSGANVADLSNASAISPSPIGWERAGVRVPMDFGNDLFPAMLDRGARLLAYNSPEYIKDIGTPERYDRICAEFAAGVVQRSALDTKQPAVFLDRDGTLVKEVDCLTSVDQLELLPGAAAAVRELNHRGIRAVLVTNQPVIAKGFCTEAQLQTIHRKLETLLGQEHAFLDRIYYCPHHPEKGFAGEIPELKIECDCRKPKPGMLNQAVLDLNLDVAAAWMVGDTTTDIETARNAGIKAVLVRTGYGGTDGKFPVKPDFMADNLLDATQLILAKTKV
jgi:histidinol-phosphate phosphatase family protein